MGALLARPLSLVATACCELERGDEGFWKERLKGLETSEDAENSHDRCNRGISSRFSAHDRRVTEARLAGDLIQGFVLSQSVRAQPGTEFLNYLCRCAN